ncbi:hypothetical protein [Brachybacterium endophyticum]|nr:hypothetical protein [Brachybacterium endophyticum]
MRLNRLTHTARAALRTDRGRQAAGRATDVMAGTARRYAPKHRRKIDKAEQSARSYIERGGQRDLR